MDTVKLLINGLGFQAAWWACVLGVMFGVPLAGPAAMLLFLIIHSTRVSNISNEWKFIIAAGILGTAVDSALAYSGVIKYFGGWSQGIPAPLWISAMWMGFAATLFHALKWMRRSNIIGILMGVIFGPLSYYTGVKMGVLEFPFSTPLALIVLAMVWGSAIPLLYHMSKLMGVQSE